jgi:hypothetical protein
MPKRSRKPRPTDPNQLAALIVAQATGTPGQEMAAAAPSGKNPAAVALGRLGGLKGGIARAKKLSAKERHVIARKAALSRWKSNEKKSRS